MRSRPPITAVCPQSSFVWSNWGRSLQTNRVRYFHRRWHEENARRCAPLCLFAKYILQLKFEAQTKTPAPALACIAIDGIVPPKYLRTGFEASLRIRTRRPRTTSIARAVVPPRTKLSQSIRRSSAISGLLAEDANADCARGEGAEVRGCSADCADLEPTRAGSFGVGCERRRRVQLRLGIRTSHCGGNRSRRPDREHG